MWLAWNCLLGNWATTRSMLVLQRWIQGGPTCDMEVSGLVSRPPMSMAPVAPSFGMTSSLRLVSKKKRGISDTIAAQVSQWHPGDWHGISFLRDQQDNVAYQPCSPFRPHWGQRRRCQRHSYLQDHSPPFWLGRRGSRISIWYVTPVDIVGYY